MLRVFDGLGLNSELKSSFLEMFLRKGIDLFALKLLKLIDMNFSEFLPPSGEIRCNLHPRL